MTHYEDIWGDVYEDEEEARDDFENNLTWDNIDEQLVEDTDFFYQLMEWARKQPTFFDEFGDKLSEIEEEMFQHMYKEVEDD